MTKGLDKNKIASYKIFDKIAPTYDLLNHLLSFGIDIYWRAQFKKYLPQEDSLTILDLATGTGDVPLTLAKGPDKGRDKRIKKIVGIDLSQEMVHRGIEKVKKHKLADLIILQKGDGVQIPCGDHSFDVVTISFGIRNFYDPEASLRDIRRVLKKRGRVLIMEFSLPKNPIIRRGYFFYFRRILPFIGNLISRHKDAYSYLNKTVEDFPYGEQFKKMMVAAGFENVSAYPLTFGIATLYVGDLGEKKHV